MCVWCYMHIVLMMGVYGADEACVWCCMCVVLMRGVCVTNKGVCVADGACVCS